MERMARSGSIVITGGGGGIPVYVDGEGMLQPLEGVIDKDLASAMIGARVKADELYILTDVPYIYKDSVNRPKRFWSSSIMPIR